VIGPVWALCALGYGGAVHRKQEPLIYGAMNTEIASTPVDHAPPRGVDVIADNLKRLPSKPGVYRMIDADGDVLYVGKAKSLKNRVSNYAKLGGHTNRIARMIALTASMEFVTTATETEALLLEANLIKRLKPRFNVLMRDDKSFPYILIRTDHEAPQIVKHRGARGPKGEYFGPFASANAVNRTMNTLQKAFLIRSCTDSVFASRSRPCMLHQIKRCAAPCVSQIAKEDYQALVDDSVRFLRGKSADLQDTLAETMHEAAENLDFERAARLRDRIRALAAIRANQTINPATFQEADVFAIAVEGGVSCIQVFFFRAGQNWGNRAYFPRHERDVPAEEVLDAFLAQFYDDKAPPSLILTSHEPPGHALLEEALSIRFNQKLDLHCPQRGEKRDIVLHALTNAKEALARRTAESATQTRLLDGVAKLFGLSAPPERIEVYDNSHIQGSNAVGAMIVAGPDGFEKSQYRKFTIKGAEVAKGDDFAMMREVLTRRFARLLKEDNDGPEGQAAQWPDLVIIDGGEGQLKVATEVLHALDLTEDIAVVSIAKGVERDAGRERFFLPGKPPFRLEPNDPVLYYLQRLRDESHRFVIGAHRAKRSADITKNPLDEIPGVGPSRKKALLARFGSAQGVARAGLSDLETTQGVDRALAKRVYDYFRAS